MNELRQTMFRVAILVFIFVTGSSTASLALDNGAKAPDFRLPGTKGAVQLADALGSVVYVDFWASWCGPCRQSFPWMNEMQEKYREKGLKVIAVNVDAKSDDAKKFLTQNAAKFIVAFDAKGMTPAQYGVKGMPSSFIIGRDGRVMSTHLGFNASDKGKLENDIKTALEAR